MKKVSQEVEKEVYKLSKGESHSDNELVEFTKRVCMFVARVDVEVRGGLGFWIGCALVRGEYRGSPIL